MSLDVTSYRDIWGAFATGVTVITTDCDGWLHGMTANGVTSLSLDPLLMLVCVDQGARCHAQLTEAGKFGVSLLARSQEDVSNLFARGEDPQEGLLRGVAFRFVVVEAKTRAGFERNRPFGECADAQFGTLKVHQHGDRTACLLFEAPDNIVIGAMIDLLAMAEVQPKHVHPSLEQVGNFLLRRRGRS